MKLTATVDVETSDIKALQQCFVAEQQAMQTKRSSVETKVNGETMHFAVSAKDPTALRATLHTITKLLSVFEKGAKK